MHVEIHLLRLNTAVYIVDLFPLSSCFACCLCQHCTAGKLSAGPCISFGLAAAKGHKERVVGNLEFVSQTLPAFDLLSKDRIVRRFHHSKVGATV